MPQAAAAGRTSDQTRRDAPSLKVAARAERAGDVAAAGSGTGTVAGVVDMQGYFYFVPSWSHSL
jgi:hypothetical protein